MPEPPIQPRPPYIHESSLRCKCNHWRVGDITGDPSRGDLPQATFTPCPACFPGYGKVQDVFDRPAMVAGDWSQEPHAAELRWWDLAKALGADHEVEHSRTCTRWVRHTLTLNGRFVLWELTDEERASETLDAQEGRLNTHARILVQHVYGVAAAPECYTKEQLRADCRLKCTATRVFDNCGPSILWRCNHPGHMCGGIMLEKSWNGDCPKCFAPVTPVEHVGP